MSKEVQLRGHDAETANLFIGLDREVTVDTDNRELRLHDGITPGGARILNRDQNDERYQARSTELDGLLGWEPNEVGIVTRVGSGEYRLRVLTVNEDNLKVTNGEGHDGNPLLELAVTIASDHTFTGEITFTQPIQATAGLIGDTTGLHTGDVIGNVTGNLTGDSTGHHTGDVTGNLTGGFDTRGADIIMDDAQIDPDWIAGFGDLLSQAGLPIGSIVMWSGAISGLPTNWKVCDGTAGTPDLRDRFIIGAGVENSVGDSGGADSHSHALTTDPTGAHSHTGSVGDTVLTVDQMPKHRHNNGVVDQATNKIFCYGGTAAPAGDWDHVENSGSGNMQGYTSYTGGFGIDGETQPHTHALTTDAGGAHTHEGGTSLASNLPPYFALLFIMKVA